MLENRRLNLTRGSNKKIQNLRKRIQIPSAQLRKSGHSREGRRRGRRIRIRIDKE
jgi:hypothetical protein